MKIVCSQFLLFTAIVVVNATNNINPKKCVPRPRSACLDDCCQRYTKKSSGDGFRKERQRCKDKCRDSYRIVFKDCTPIEPEPPPPPSGPTIIDYADGFPCNEGEVPFSLNQNPDPPLLMEYDDKDECFVRMTPNSKDLNIQGPSMFLSHDFDKKNTKYSFEMTAGYRMYGDQTYADGIAFLLHQDDSGVEAFGRAGGGLGYYRGISPAIAIELDTFENDDHQDIGKNYIHVLHVDTSNTRQTLAQVRAKFLRTGGDGTKHGRLWVDYHDEEIRVYLDPSGEESKPQQPQVAVPFSLNDIFDGNTVFIGFTAGTWMYTDNQDILDWTMAEA